MIFFKTKIPFYKKKKFVIPLTILLVLITLRIIIEPILHKKVNEFLADFSPSISAHIDDLDLSILRGAYSFQGVTAKLRKEGKEFMKVSEIDVSLSWRSLFKGRVLTDIKVTELNLRYVNHLPEAFKSADEKDEPTKVKETLFPVQVGSFDIENSKIILEDYTDMTGGNPLMINNIFGKITNLTPQERNPLSFFNLRGTFMDSSVFKTAGHLNMVKKPMQWNADGEIQEFDLVTLNQFLKRKLPLTFTKGKMDLYTEVKSEGGKIVGYVKPFMKNLDIVASKEKFEGPKHWFIEIGVAIANLILRASDTKTVASKIPFSFDEKFSIETGEAVSQAVDHGFIQQISPGIEDTIDIKE